MVPFIFTYDDSLGFSLEGQSRFSVIFACSRKWYQFFMGKSGSVDQRSMIK